MLLNHPIRRALLLAAAYLLTAVLLDELRQRQVLNPETVQRLLGILMGMVLVVSANFIPKRLVPLAHLSCDPAREQTLRRFGVKALFLGGMGYTLAFALAPIAMASTLAISLLAPAVVAVASITARCAWMRRRTK
jgi:small-conductance mechanosensitive channel